MSERCWKYLLPSLVALAGTVVLRATTSSTSFLMLTLLIVSMLVLPKNGLNQMAFFPLFFLHPCIISTITNNTSNHYNCFIMISTPSSSWDGMFHLRGR